MNLELLLAWNMDREATSLGDLGVGTRMSNDLCCVMSRMRTSQLKRTRMGLSSPSAVYPAPGFWPLLLIEALRLHMAQSLRG